MRKKPKTRRNVWCIICQRKIRYHVRKLPAKHWWHFKVG